MSTLAWFLGGLVLLVIGVKRLVSAVTQFFGGHPQVAVDRHLGRGSMFLGFGAVIVVAVWQVGGFG
jgi:hypothetical protein